jgi:hypothetical protein
MRLRGLECPISRRKKCWSHLKDSTAGESTLGDIKENRNKTEEKIAKWKKGGKQSRSNRGEACILVKISTGKQD